MLKQGNYEIWRLRIEQYFQVQDYALWDVIKNENSFKPVAHTITNDAGTSTTLIPGPVTTEEKAQKKCCEGKKHNEFDDLYNNFKIVKQEVKGTANSSSSLNSQNMAFVSSPSSTNEINTAYEVSTTNTQANPASTQVNTASTQVSTANLSDVTVYAFLASQPNGSQLAHKDLVQIHKDDLEKMDLKCQLALLRMRTRRFFQKTSRKITIKGNDTAGYDKSKVECFNCHKLGYFARECRQPRNQDSRNKNQDNSKKTVHVEYTSSNAMVVIDGADFDWNFMADDEIPTNMALMAFLNSETSKSVCEDISNEVKEYHDAPLVKDMVLDNKDCLVDSPLVEEKKTVVPIIAKVEFVRPKQQEKPVRKTVRPVKTARTRPVNTARPNSAVVNDVNSHPQKEDQGYVNSGCSRHMTGNMSYLFDFMKFNGGYVTFKRGAKGGRITGKGTLKTASKDKTTRILKKFITKIENLVDKKIKVIRCDNGIEFKNSVMNDFCAMKGIRREFSVAQTPQQNGVAERRNKILIEAARIMVLVVKPHNKTPYKLFRGRNHALSFMRPFGCHVIILNTLDHLGKFDGKSDDGFFIGYSLNSKDFRVYNLRTRKVKENLHIRFLEDKPSVASNGPKWLFDIDVLTKSMNYVPVVVGVSEESEIDNQEKSKNSTQDVNTVGPSINTASTNVNTKVDLSNILNTYLVPSTPNTRIHKDHLLDHFGFSRPDITFAVCTCARFQVTPKVSYLHAVKRIFRYLKGQPKLGLWYLKDLLIELEAYTDSDYAGASLDMKSTTRGCQFLRSRLISWQCKKQTVVTNSTTEAEYVATASINLQLLVMVTAAEKPTESEGFEQIIDFLNANPIKYALMVNPTIYTLCIKQFWAMVKVKTVNGEEHIQALVDKKKVIITETTGSESRPPMLNKENYVPQSSRLLRYAKSRPNRKLIHNSILNGPYVRRMIPAPGDANREVTMTETFHPEWSRHVTIVHQTKDLHTVDYTQLYDFLKYNQKEVDELKAKILAKTQDPIALMANSNNPYAFPAPNQDQLSFNQNYLQQPMPNPEDMTDPTTRISSNPRNRQIAQPGMIMGQDRQMQMVGEEYDLMAAAADIDEIKEVNANCILMANLQQASTSSTQTDKAPVYDSDGSAENDNNVISEDTSVEQGGEIVEQHLVNFKETRALYDSLYQNLAIEVEKVNSVNRKLKETNVDRTTELARFKNQTRCFEISQEKYDKLERCYQQSVYQEQCLFKKINALHLSTEATKFVGDFKSLANEADASLAKHKALELDIKRLLKAVVSQDIMNIVQKESVVDTSDLQTELEHYKDMQQKIERLQAQLGDLKGKSKDTSCVSETHNPLS
uniref:Ribonuclease H-like domain-containing protein n=1 Tax=Tanacetum cinerariifolium TaxID=118510 RepID=A0A6L2JXZ1_TANCI|nr:ribonuclease H-like domain-containing protein [Tanacetum cinerariifolium]